MEQSSAAQSGRGADSEELAARVWRAGLGSSRDAGRSAGSAAAAQPCPQPAAARPALTAAPSSSTRSSGGSPRARRATSLPTLPKPMMASVLPTMLTPTHLLRSHCGGGERGHGAARRGVERMVQSRGRSAQERTGVRRHAGPRGTPLPPPAHPSRTLRAPARPPAPRTRPPFMAASACATLRASAHSSAMPCSAAATVLAVGAFTTRQPVSEAAARSTLSMPTPARPTTLSRPLEASNTSRVICRGLFLECREAE